MKNRKFKRNVFIFVLVLCLSTAILPCLAAGETIDIEGLEEYDHTAVVEFIDSYGVTVLQTSGTENMFHLVNGI